MNIIRITTTGAIAACLWVTMTPAQAEDVPVVWLERERITCDNGQMVIERREGVLIDLSPVVRDGVSGYVSPTVDWSQWVEVSRSKGCPIR